MTGIRTDLHQESIRLQDRQARLDAPQTFEQRFGSARLQDVLRYTMQGSMADLPPLLIELGANKKKSDDPLTIQTHIDDRAGAADSVGNEYAKPQVSTGIIKHMRSYAWASVGNDITEGITPFNIFFSNEPAAKAAREKVDQLSTVESGQSAMSHQDAAVFTKKDVVFPVDLYACTQRLQAHSVMVDLMLGVTHPFSVAYRACLVNLPSLMLNTLTSHYGQRDALLLGVRIMYWITQHFLYYLSELKLGRAGVQLPDFAGLERSVNVKTVENFVPQLPTGWVEYQSGSRSGASTGTNTPKGERVTNIHYVDSIKKRWKESGHSTMAEMIRAKPADSTVPIPKIGNEDACLSYHVKGSCFSNCPRKASHKHIGTNIVAGLHAYLDACNMPQAS